MKINKKLILLSAVVGSLFTGCAVKDVNVSQSQSNWKSDFSMNEESGKKRAEECKGETCMASIIKPRSRADRNSYVKFSKQKNVVCNKSVTPQDEQHFASGVIETTIEYDYSNSPFSEDIRSNDIAVQVGAFRKFSGAKRYAKRYSLLGRHYSIAIKKDFKNSKPIYRVHINGFTSNVEAKKFINRYGTQDAFLVRR